jgi:cell division protein FtsA
LPRSRFVSALDIGTTKICCVIGEQTERGLNVLGVGEVPSEGLRRGVVVNMEKTTRGITSAVEAAERMSGHKVEIGLVPFGSIGMTLFAVDLWLASRAMDGGELRGLGAVRR